MQTKSVSPTGSYSLLVPLNAEESTDGAVVSYWIPGDDTLLLLSSNKRTMGEQVAARERLRLRVAGGGLRDVAEVPVVLPWCPDVAAASARDDEGMHWIFVYAVWPDLMILATASHPMTMPSPKSWPLRALLTIRRTAPQGQERQ